MRKFIFLIITILICSCSTNHLGKVDIAGLYTGFDDPNHHPIGYNYTLHLYNDSTFKYIKYRDLFKVIGIGKWYNCERKILLKYDTIYPSDISDVLMAISYMTGADTIIICNNNKIKINNTKLLKTGTTYKKNIVPQQNDN
ncbi:hypothetical protein [Sodaliphilus sp.]|uniref:hypothetical protein n=1 Tax=Sodaliphilus sp. TaxID=2815818 RepID=UPI00389041F1